jgi:SAM-dependent methyltransferase
MTGDMTYDRRIAQQIEQYAETVNMHDLPQSFHVWSHHYIRPALLDVFGIAGINDFYCTSYSDAVSGVSGTKRVLSIGCGDGLVEIEMAQTLIARGERDFVVTVADLSPILLGRCTTEVQRLGLEAYFHIVECDLNDMASVSAISGPFDLIMANHSLHHIVELEKLFDFSLAALKGTGIFVTNDMIGRNGHMRWPETDAVVRSFWPMLSLQQRYNVQLKRLEDPFIDHDCSTEAFEGIRSQDILPLMLQRFSVRKFVGVGGFIDLFVDRGFGHGFKPENSRDLALIHCIARLNEIMLDAGTVKPTIMFAQFAKTPCVERFYRSRSSGFSVRLAEPDWVAYVAATAAEAYQAPITAGTPDLQLAANQGPPVSTISRRLRRLMGR